MAKKRIEGMQDENLGWPAGPAPLRFVEATPAMNGLDGLTAEEAVSYADMIECQEVDRVVQDD